MVCDVVGYFLQYLGYRGYLNIPFTAFYYFVMCGLIKLRHGFSLEFFVSGCRQASVFDSGEIHLVFSRNSGSVLGDKRDEDITIEGALSLYNYVSSYDFGASIYNLLSENGTYLE